MGVAVKFYDILYESSDGNNGICLFYRECFESV